MAYATFRLWPSWPDDDDPIELERGDPIPQVHDTRLQGVVRSVPPVRWIDLPPPEDRISVYGQLFGSSVIVLLTSLCLEVVFGLGT